MRTRTCLSSTGVELVTIKIAMFEIYNLLKWESRFTLGINAAKKYGLYEKMLQIKIIGN